jgi:hypothetical protein
MQGTVIARCHGVRSASELRIAWAFYAAHQEISYFSTIFILGASIGTGFDSEKSRRKVITVYLFSGSGRVTASLGAFYVDSKGYSRFWSLSMDDGHDHDDDYTL